MGKKPKIVHFDTGIVLLNKDNIETYKDAEMAAAKTMAENFDDLWE